ncbi:hypothetical protein M405DRAFT_867515 [Rhizopogon salebrosus TDB-379]|nr:hypothetical protein M405DRAFT_867515 [Rhizopogon salebrosus TDB-379]
MLIVYPTHNLSEHDFSSSPDNIPRLSESETNKILAKPTATLRLLPRSMMNLLPECLDEDPELVSLPPNSVGDIRTSMDSLASVDELSLPVHGGDVQEPLIQE